MNATLSDIAFPIFELKDGLIYSVASADDVVANSDAVRRWFPGMEIVDGSWNRYTVQEARISGSVGPLWGLWEARFLGRRVRVDLVLKPLSKGSSLVEMQDKVLKYVKRWTQYSAEEQVEVRARIAETSSARDLATVLNQAFTGKLVRE